MTPNTTNRSVPADPLELYMREARTHDLLKPEEEKALLNAVVESRDRWMFAFLHCEAGLKQVWSELQAWKAGEIAALSLIPGPPKPQDEKSGPTYFCTRLHRIFERHVARFEKRPFRRQKATRRLVRSLIYVGFRPAPLTRYRNAALNAGNQRVHDRIHSARQAFLQMRMPLIEKNLRLVMKLAHNFVPGPLSYAELIQEGNLGLIRSTESFSPRFGVRFSTYAYLWIRQSILRALENKSRTIRLPVSLTQELRKLEKAHEELMAAGEEAPASNRLTGMLANPCVSRPVLSLDHSLDDETDLAHVIADRNMPSPELVPTKGDTGTFVRNSLDLLPDRQRLILRLRFGIDCKRAHTLTEIGELLGVSAERIRQLQQQALTTLRDSEDASILEQLVLD